MADLLPCPFCGGAPKMERPGTAQQNMIVVCSSPKCGARIESGDVVGLTDPQDYRWNRRRTPDLEAMRAALEMIKDLSRPGQKINISQATDIICDIRQAALVALARGEG